MRGHRSPSPYASPSPDPFSFGFSHQASAMGLWRLSFSLQLHLNLSLSPPWHFLSLPSLPSLSISFFLSPRHCKAKLRSQPLEARRRTHAGSLNSKDTNEQLPSLPTASVQRWRRVQHTWLSLLFTVSHRLSPAIPPANLSAKMLISISSSKQYPLFAKKSAQIVGALFCVKTVNFVSGSESNEALF